jgi:ABC-type dipeptide/oligopeptide/nickel transport system ATPase component
MCQRVMITIALAAKPSLLIADGQTTGLDVTTQAVVAGSIGELAAESAWRRSPSHDLLAAQRAKHIDHACRTCRGACETQEMFATAPSLTMS